MNEEQKVIVIGADGDIHSALNELIKKDERFTLIEFVDIDTFSEVDVFIHEVGDGLNVYPNALSIGLGTTPAPLYYNGRSWGMGWDLCGKEGLDVSESDWQKLLDAIPGLLEDIKGRKAEIPTISIDDVRDIASRVRGAIVEPGIVVARMERPQPPLDDAIETPEGARESPTRNLGDVEVRNLSAHAGPQITLPDSGDDDFLDRLDKGKANMFFRRMKTWFSRILLCFLILVTAAAVGISFLPDPLDWKISTKYVSDFRECTILFPDDTNLNGTRTYTYTYKQLFGIRWYDTSDVTEETSILVNSTGLLVAGHGGADKSDVQEVKKGEMARLILKNHPQYTFTLNGMMMVLNYRSICR